MEKGASYIQVLIFVALHQYPGRNDVDNKAENRDSKHPHALDCRRVHNPLDGLIKDVNGNRDQRQPIQCSCNDFKSFKAIRFCCSCLLFSKLYSKKAQSQGGSVAEHMAGI
ncbi:Uncharacterised protein [Mycobacteroides abscessus subsp. abscessus]|nr:Uncharacterised protein [Mycobacteroides abscessus subsp. abscessus]